MKRKKRRRPKNLPEIRVHVPVTIHRSIKAEAKRAGRSISSEVNRIFAGVYRVTGE